MPIFFGHPNSGSCYQNAQTFILQNIFLFTKYQCPEKISLFPQLRTEINVGAIMAPLPSFSFVKYPRPLRVRKAAKKKVLLLMAGPLRPNPPSSLMAVGMLERWKKRFQKQLFLNGQALPPPPLLMAIKRRTFLRLPLDISGS